MEIQKMKMAMVIILVVVLAMGIGYTQSSIASLISKSNVEEITESTIVTAKQYGFEYFPLNTEVSYLYDSNAGKTESGVVLKGDELVLTYDAGKISYEQQFFKGEKGIYLTRTHSSALLFFGKTVTYPEPVLRLPLPLQIGDKWYWEGFEIVDGDTGSLTIKGKALAEEKVSTLVGEFNCLKIQLKVESEQGSKNTVTEWLAPGIGVVKFHAALEGTGLTTFLQDIFGLDELTFDLTGFNINKN
jgi:hypothetical protein